MLDLYANEIPRPEDRTLSTYLWTTQFHDAVIHDLRYEDPRRSNVTLRIEGGCGVAHGVYRLCFQGVAHVEYAASPLGGDRIYSTCFLDSAALHQEQAESDKPLYHLRIQTWNGFIDLIFARLILRKEDGRVSYHVANPSAEEADQWRNRHLRSLFELLQPLEARDEDDQDQLLALRLYFAHREQAPAQAAAMAREVLSTPLLAHGAAHTYAAHMLGFLGTAEDLPVLTDLLLVKPAWHTLFRRRVLDAMERIQERSAPHA